MEEVRNRIISLIKTYETAQRDIRERFAGPERAFMSDLMVRNESDLYESFSRKIEMLEALIEALPSLTLDQAEQELAAIRRGRR